MKDNIYTKYFKKRNESLDLSEQNINSKRIYETFNSALNCFNFNSFNQNQQLIDLGCGDRSFIKYAEEKGLSTKGFDVDDGINFEKDKLPLDDNSIDHIITNSVIEHLYNPNIFLSEIKRTLKFLRSLYQIKLKRKKFFLLTPKLLDQWTERVLAKDGLMDKDHLVKMLLFIGLKKINLEDKIILKILINILNQ